MAALVQIVNPTKFCSGLLAELLGMNGSPCFFPVAISMLRAPATQLWCAAGLARCGQVQGTGPSAWTWVKEN